jgi:hypothetical protein
MLPKKTKTIFYGCKSPVKTPDATVAEMNAMVGTPSESVSGCDVMVGTRTQAVHNLS